MTVGSARERKMSEKDEKIEQKIPIEWRSVISEIVDDIKNRNLASKNIMGHAVSVDRGQADHIYNNILHYGCELVTPPDEAWQTSVCRWMHGYWHLLIDLYTAEEGASDLVLFMDVYENGESASFKIRSLHVP
jgi:hypothetical protein